MKNKKILLALTSLLAFNGIAYAENCVPAFVVADKKYTVETEQREMVVKIKKIDAASCWVKVKEILPDEPSAFYSADRKEIFWLNMANVTVVRKKT